MGSLVVALSVRFDEPVPACVSILRFVEVPFLSKMVDRLSDELLPATNPLLNDVPARRFAGAVISVFQKFGNLLHVARRFESAIDYRRRVAFGWLTELDKYCPLVRGDLDD
jgi:hypothetical protein